MVLWSNLLSCDGCRKSLRDHPLHYPLHFRQLPSTRALPERRAEVRLTTLHGVNGVLSYTWQLTSPLIPDGPVGRLW
jgi:hypothetical protein